MFASLALAAAVAAAPAPAVQRQSWVAPLAAPLRVVRAFDPPAVRWESGHRGVDLVADVGATVRSAAAGRVTFAGMLAARGVVVVAHGALRTTYEPVEASVRVGEPIARGDPIGRLRTGHQPARPALAILHWGLLRDQNYLDPMSVLSEYHAVRLLPHWGNETQPASSASGGTAPLIQADGRRIRTRGRRRERPVDAGGAALLSVALGAGLAVATRRPP